MADKFDVQVTGKSEAEIIHQMAIQILVTVENKSLSKITRAEYLNAHVDAYFAIRGSRPE